MPMTHSEHLSNSQEEDQRSVREGVLEEVGLELGLEGKERVVRVVKRWRGGHSGQKGCWAHMAGTQALRVPGCLE